ncbi:1285_t:CDS:2, partial [Racocetra persica]
KTYLSDYTFLDNLNHTSSSNFNYSNQQPEYELSNNNSLNYNSQQIELNSAQSDDDQRSYYRNNNYQDYRNQHTINSSLDNIKNQEFEELDREFEDGLESNDNIELNREFEDNLKNIESELNNNISCYSSDDKYKPIDNTSKKFDRMKSDINWHRDCPFGSFENFTNMAIFIWATNRFASENDIVGVLCHNANLGYCSCKASKNELTNISFDIYSNSQYHQITNQEFEIINTQQTKSA